jgi:hypothetical protein
MKKAREVYSFGEIKLGEFDAEKCTKCKELFFTEEASDRIDEKAKELGLWGMEQETKIGYSGNSIIVRVPKKIAVFLGFKKGKKVHIRPEGKKKLVVEA